jgi:hypothetical protein
MPTAYDIQHYNSSLLVAIPEGTVDTDATSLRLIGRNVQFYGDFQNENLVWLLENFAKATAPTNPLLGQLWYDTAANTIKLFSNGNVWRTLAPAISATEPSDQVLGDLWFNTTTEQLFVKLASSYVLVGPTTPKNWGLTEVKAEEFTDTLAVVHKVLSVYIAGVRQYVFSSDTDYTTAGPVAGFATVKRGMNSNTLQTGSVFNGDALNALKLGGVLADDYLRGDIDDTTTGVLHVANNGGITLGAGNELLEYLNTGSPYTNFGVLENTVESKGWLIKGLRTGVPENLLIIDGNGTVTVPGDLIVLGDFYATFANQLTTPREIAISGFISGSAMFDGSADITIVGSTAYDPVNKAGDVMTGNLTLPINGFLIGENTMDGAQLIASGSKIGIFTNAPTTTLDVNGSLKAGFRTNGTTSGNISIDAVASTNHQINLTGVATVTINNLSNTGQICRVILTATNNAVTWPVNVYWPNGTAPNLAAGPQKVAIVTLFKPNAAYVLATYITY